MDTMTATMTDNTNTTATISLPEVAPLPMKVAPRAYQGKHAKGKNQKGCFGSNKSGLEWLEARAAELARSILDTGKPSEKVIAQISRRCGAASGEALAKHLMGKNPFTKQP